VSVSDLLLIVGVIAVAAFGFLNGWALRRAVARTTAASRPRDARGRATRGDVSADLHDEYVSDTDGGEHRPYREVEAALAASRIEVCELKARIAQFDDLEDRLRARDESLTDLKSRHRAHLHKKDAERRRCEARMIALCVKVDELRDMEQMIAEMEVLEERLAAAEERRRARVAEHEAKVLRRDAGIGPLLAALGDRGRESFLGAPEHPPRKGTAGRYRGVVPNPSGLPHLRLRQHADSV